MEPFRILYLGGLFSPCRGCSKGAQLYPLSWYQVESTVGFANTCRLDSDLPVG